MNKLQFFEAVEKLMNYFIISVVGSFIRMIFFRNEPFGKTVLTFLGGILLGTLVGYLIAPIFPGWDKVATAVTAIIGKEFVMLMINDLPNVIRKFVNKKAGTDDINNIS